MEISMTELALLQANDSVPKEMSKREFMLRAWALRVPGFQRATRAVRLFCTPMPGTRARAARAQAALPNPTAVTQHQVLHKGVRYQAYTVGAISTGCYLLCSHGWSSFGLRFASWFDAATAAGYGVVCFDHGAHGGSDGEIATFPSFVAGINAMRAHFGEPAAAIGHSFGGAALALAAAENGLAAPLVLIAAPSNLMVALRYFASRTKMPPELVNNMALALSKIAGRDIRHYHARATAGNIHQRVLVIHDIADDEVSWNAGLHYAMLAPNARLQTRVDVGHHRILSDPQTIEQSLAFIAGQDQGQRMLASDLDLQIAFAEA